jgi:integrase
VATEYAAHLKAIAQSGQITMGRWQTVDGYIRLHLIPCMGRLQIVHVGEAQWTAYPTWRRQNSVKHTRRRLRRVTAVPAQPEAESVVPAKDGTVRQEMMTFRAIMRFAAKKRYIKDNQVPEGKLPVDRARRDAFSPQEYRHLHTFARSWIKEGRGKGGVWTRNMAYNFMLVMTNTGMRTIEAANLRWRDIDVRKDKEGRAFVCINVHGKDKFRELVAADSVASYLDRIRALSRATGPDDFVFSTYNGKPAKTLYILSITDLLRKSNQLFGASGSRRSSYCFRHTYATFRLMAGVDVFMLAKQMGTSVQMIEDYYGHITASKNAARILQGIPGWDSALPASSEPTTGVNAGSAGATLKKGNGRQ